MDKSDCFAVNYHDVQVGDLTLFQGVWVTITRVELVDVNARYKKGRYDDPPSEWHRLVFFISPRTKIEDHWQVSVTVNNTVMKFYRPIEIPEEELEL